MSVREAIGEGSLRLALAGGWQRSAHSCAARDVNGRHRFADGGAHVAATGRRIAIAATFRLRCDAERDRNAHRCYHSRMRFDLANLPNNIDTLRGMIVTQAANFAAELGARETELATAKAGLLAKTLEIEKLKLHIARLRRAQFGRSAEKIARTIEQLELMLGDLEAHPSFPTRPASSLAADVAHSSTSKRAAR